MCVHLLIHALLSFLDIIFSSLMASVLEAPTHIVSFLTHNSGRLGEPIYRLTTVSLYFLPTLSEAELQIEPASSPASNMLKTKKNRSGSLPRTIFSVGLARELQPDLSHHILLSMEKRPRKVGDSDCASNASFVKDTRRFISPRRRDSFMTRSGSA